jgi:hypothetical protein
LDGVGWGGGLWVVGWGGGKIKIMCSNSVLLLNEDQSRLCPGSAARQFKVLAPAAVTNMVMTMTVMIMRVYHHHHHQQR